MTVMETVVVMTMSVERVATGMGMTVIETVEVMTVTVGG